MNKLLLTLFCCLPLRHIDLTSGFGYRIHPITKEYRFHSGIDLRARSDTVFAIAAGAASVGYNGLIGLYVRITDGQFCAVYGHLSRILLGDSVVTAGTPIAITGATGRVTGEHLHLSMSFNGQLLDPLLFLYQLTIKTP
jgi:murein DD-endopeptidase MepM/ murein hydrolase activator NlpD